MAEATGFGLDFSDAALQADKIEKTIKNTVQHAEDLEQHMKKAFESGTAQSFKDIVSRLSRDIESLNKTKVTINVDSSQIEDAVEALDEVVKDANVLSKKKVELLGKKEKVELFDSESLITSNKGLAEAERNLNIISATLEGLKEKWSKVTSAKYQYEEFKPKEFVAPKDPKDNKPYGANTREYKAAYAEYLKQIAEEEKAHAKLQKEQEKAFIKGQKRQTREVELRIKTAIEKEAIAKKELAWEKMTLDERAQYVKKRLEEIVKAEQKRINEIRKEYSQINKDLVDVVKSRENLKSSSVSTKSGKGKEQLDSYNEQFDELNRRRLEIESKHGDLVADIARRTQRKVFDMTVANENEKAKIEERNRKQKEKDDLASYQRTVNAMLTLQRQYEANERKYAKGGSTNTDLANDIAKQKAKFEELSNYKKNLEDSELQGNAKAKKIREDYETSLIEIHAAGVRARQDEEERARKQRERDAKADKAKKLAEYKAVLDEMLTLQRQYEGNERSKKKYGDDRFGGFAESQKERYGDLDERKVKLEEALGGELELTKRYQAKKIEIEASGLRDTIRTQQEAYNKRLAQYKEVLSKMLILERQIDSNERKNKDGKLDATIGAQRDILQKLEDQRKNIKDSFSDSNADILEADANLEAQRLQIKTGAIKDEIAADKAAKKEAEAREKAHQKQILAEYKQTLSDIVRVQKEIDKAKKANKDGKNDDVIQFYENYKKGLEKQADKLGGSITRPEQAAQRDKASEKHLEKLIELEEKRNKVLKETQDLEYRTSMAGALDYAQNHDKTEDEIIQAQAYLRAARKKVDKSDTASIKQLNDEYARLRSELEKITTAEQNRMSLRPRLSTDYKQYLREQKELNDELESAIKLQKKYQLAHKTTSTPIDDIVAKLEARKEDVDYIVDELERVTDGNLNATKVEFDSDVAAKELREFEKLEEEKLKKKREVWERYNKTRPISESTANKAIANADNAKNVLQEEEALNKLLDARDRLNTTNGQNQETLERLNEEIAKHEHNIKMATSATYRKQQADKAQKEADEAEHARRTTMQGALDYSKNEVKSINDRIKAIKYLKEAREKLAQGNDEQAYKKKVAELTEEIERQQNAVDELTGKMKEAGNEKTHLGRLAEQLKRRLAVAFGVASMKNFLQKMIEVRGEFEKQQRALQAILQNKDKADEIWDKTVKLAVKSPFTVKELVTYTKEMAAYRIETDKLHDTTKRLADLSAGLGVDMSRLILAYGQVSAAKFLRATELRQFTEAGIPLLDELANHFSSLEKRAVSAADVFDRISKRMVTFRDVEAVLNKMTNAGGVFYNMQEVQAQTVGGMISNLRDQYELMLNDIGKSQEGLIKSMLVQVKTLVSYWEELLPHIASAGIAITSYLSIAHLASYLRGVKGISNALKALQASSYLNPWVLGITAVVAALGAWYMHANKVNKVMKEMRKVEHEVNKELSESKRLYKELADEVNDATKTTEEQMDALSRLQSKFKEILPNNMIEETFVRNIANGYDAATQAMLAYYDKKAFAQKQSVAEEKFTKDVGTDINDFLSGIDDVAKVYGWSEDVTSVVKQASEKAINHAVTLIKEGKKGIDEFYKITSEEMLSWTEGDAKATEAVDKLLRFYIQNAQGRFNQGEGTFQYGVDKVGRNIHELLEDIQTYQKTMEGVYGLSAKNTNDAKATLFWNKEKDGIEKVTGAYNALYAVMRTVSENKEGGNTSEDAEKRYQTLVSDLPEQYRGVFEEAYGNLKEHISSTWDFETNGREITKNFYESLSRSFATHAQGALEPSISQYLNNEIEGIESKGQIESSAKEVYDTLVGVFASIISSHQGEEADFSNLLPSLGQSVTDYRKELEGEVSMLSDELKKYKKAKESGKGAEGLLIASDDEYEKQKTRLAVLIDMVNALGGDVAKDKEGLERLRKQISLVQQLYNEYKKLWQDKGKAYADEHAKEGGLREAFSEVGLNIDSFDLGIGQERIDGLKQLIPIAYTISGGMLELHKNISKAGLELDSLEQKLADADMQRHIESLFGRYELTLEMDNLHLPANLMKQFFGFEGIDLNGVRQEILDQLNLGGMIEMPTSEIITSDSFKALNDRQQEMLKEALKNIDEKEQKALQERYVKYSKYLIQEQKARIRIKVDEIKQLKEIDDTFYVTDDSMHQLAQGESEVVVKEQIAVYKRLLATKKEITEETLRDTILTQKQKDAILKMAETKKTAQEGVRRTTSEKYGKAQWEDFKSSPLYEMFMGDLETIGSRALDTLRDKLHGMKDAMSELDPDVFKAIMSELQKLDEIAIERNPYKEWKDARQELKTTKIDGQSLKDYTTYEEIKEEKRDGTIETKKKKLKGEEALEYDLSMGTEKEEQLQRELELYERIKAANGDITKVQADGTQITQEQLDAIMEQEDGIDGLIAKTKKDLTQQQKKNTQLKNGVETYKKADKASIQVTKNVGGWAQAVSDVLGATDAMLDAFGVAEDSTARLWIQNIMNIAQMVVSVVTLTIQLKAMEVQSNSALGVIGYVAIALSTVASLLASIFGNQDKALERQIQQTKKSVESLEKEYEKLEKAIEDTYSAADLDVYNETAQTNLQQQIDGYKKMIDLERDKKKTDEDAIADWYDAIEEKEKQMKELEANRLKELGGLGDEASYKEASESFVDAWLSAFKETGDGMKGLEEAWDEMVHNMVKQQLLTRGVDKIMTKFYDEWDKALADSAMDEKEWDYLNALMAEKREQLDEYLKGMAQNMGVEEMAGQGELDTLQKGIQGITEDQADILASYLNSIRFMVGEQVGYLKKIAGVDNATEEVRQNYNPTLTTSKAIDDLQKSMSQQEDNNPMIPHLKTIAEQTSAIHALLDSVTLSGHTRGGQGIKVFID